MSETNTVSPLRQRMIEDMAARKLNPHTQRGHIYSCKRFAAWLKRSPDTATPDEVRRLHLMSQTPCKQCGFPLPIRWPRAGGNLAQPNNIHRCADRASIRSKHPPKGLLHPAPRVPADTQVKSCQRHVYHRARRPH